MSPAVADPAKHYTIEEFEGLPDAERFELIDGRLVERNMSMLAGVVVGNLLGLLRPFNRQHRLGILSSSDTGYVLFPDSTRVRFPDASFVRAGRLPNDTPPEGHVRLAPDFAFEAVSPTDYAEEQHAKVEEYLRAGVRLVWVAYPKAQVVLAFRPDGSVRRFTAADALTAEDLFPGFACPTAELFAVV